MTAYRFTSRSQLRDVLNNVESVQKTNIDEFSWGHLNKRKLYKPPHDPDSSRIWKSSKKNKYPVRNKELFPGEKPSSGRSKSHNGRKMKEVLYEFSVGTMGSVPYPSPVKVSTPPKKEKVEEFRKETTNVGRETAESKSSRKNTTSAKSLYSELDDGILIEQLPNQELMVTSPREREQFHQPRAFKLSDPEYEIMQDLKQTLDADGYLTVKHTFLPSFSQGITKSDQFNKFRQFENVVLRKQDTRERKVLSGAKAVQHLEKQLAEVNFEIYKSLSLI